MALALVSAALLLCSVALAASMLRNSASKRRLDAISAVLRSGRVVESRTLSEAADRLERAVDARDDRQIPASSAADRRYLGALDAIALGVVVADGSGAVQYRNPFAAAFLDGRHGDAVVGQAIDELLEVALVGVVADSEVQVFGPPRRRLLLSATPIGDGAGLGALVVIDDVTEQERLDAVRRDFVANISHELRTPIGAMALLAETMVDEPDPEVVRSLAGRLSGEADRLTGTIDDLLQLSRIEHGSDEDFEPVVLGNVVRNAADRVSGAALQASVDIGISLPDRDLVVRGDALQLGSAIYNLLENSVKYMGGSGSISVRARQVGDDIVLVVQDSGIGIPRRDLDRIFERFYRVDGARSRATGGTGLGLSIVRHVIANHGGRISVDSTEGEGTTFTIELPTANVDGMEGTSDTHAVDLSDDDTAGTR